MTITEPSGLMFACITVGDTAAAETAVCAEHRDSFVPAPSFGDVEDVTLQDCSGNEALLCAVCGRDADEVAEAVERPRCPRHGYMSPRAVERQTPEQQWCGTWYDCTATRCYSSALVPSSALAEQQTGFGS